MCGPSGAEKQLEGQSANFAAALRSNYGTLFSQQQGVLQSLNRSLSPIVSAGPSQQGFSPSELAALNTQAINSAGAANKNAQQAVANYGAGRGNDSGLVSGIQRQLQAGVASNSADQLATAQNQITQADWQQGNQNFWRAQGAEQAVAGLENPGGAASGALAGNQQAFGEASQINTENNAVGQDIAGFLTAAAGSAGQVVKAIKGGG